MSNRLNELKAEGKQPKMKPNASGVIMVPVNRAYYDWHWERHVETAGIDEATRSFKINITLPNRNVRSG